MQSFFYFLIVTTYLLSMLWLKPEAQAEYRAFELVVRDAEGKEKRKILSNLDPLQYPGYYSLAPGERLEYTQTWMCIGDTSNFRPVCPNPNREPAQIAEPPPSSP